MERRWFDIGEKVRVRRADDYDWQLQGDPLPDGAFGSPATVIPGRTVHGATIPVESVFPLSFVQLDDGRVFVVHQDNLEPRTTATKRPE